MRPEQLDRYIRDWQRERDEGTAVARGVLTSLALVLVLCAGGALTLLALAGVLW